MNHKPSGSLILSKAIPFFLNYKTAEGLAERTIDSYERTLNKWLLYQGDDEIGAYILVNGSETERYTLLIEQYLNRSAGITTDKAIGYSVTTHFVDGSRDIYTLAAGIEVNALPAVGFVNLQPINRDCSIERWV